MRSPYVVRTIMTLHRGGGSRGERWGRPAQPAGERGALQELEGSSQAGAGLCPTDETHMWKRLLPREQRGNARPAPSPGSWLPAPAAPGPATEGSAGRDRPVPVPLRGGSPSASARRPASFVLTLAGLPLMAPPPQIAGQVSTAQETSGFVSASPQWGCRPGSVQL